MHRWLGLTLGLVLMSSGLTGALLVAARPIDREVNARLFEGAGPARAAGLDAAAARLRGEFPGADLVFRLPREEGETMWVYVRGAWRGQVFVDPSSGEERGRRGEREGFANAVFEWHSELLSGERGKLLLFAAAVAGVAMSVAGWVTWWPRGGAAWRSALRVAWRANGLRVLLDLHRAGGALLGALLLVSIASGAWMAWRPLAQGLDAWSGFRARELPAVERHAGIPAAPLSRLLAEADRALPGGRLSMVAIGPRADRPVRVRKRMPDEPHPNGLTSAWLHPQDATALATTPWRDGGPGLRGFEYAYPLHIGELGGPFHRLAVALAGLALFALGASGAWLWWKRGRRVA